jgi:hypothetical protein
LGIEAVESQLGKRDELGTNGCSAPHGFEAPFEVGLTVQSGGLLNQSDSHGNDHVTNPGPTR